MYRLRQRCPAPVQKVPQWQTLLACREPAARLARWMLVVAAREARQDPTLSREGIRILLGGWRPCRVGKCTSAVPQHPPPQESCF